MWRGPFGRRRRGRAGRHHVEPRRVPRDRRACGPWAVVVSAIAFGLCSAAEESLPADCLPDRLVRWDAAEPDPDSRFGATSLPGIVLGPPGDSASTTGSTSVASLGNGGRAVLELTQVRIEDGPGPDFIVFENAFFVGAAPTSPDEDYQIFAEPGIVEVSIDGEQWFQFPFDEQALDEARGTNIDKDLYERLQGLAGITPTFTGNWTVPNDPLTWDPDGQGGVSGAGGDAFDLATVGLSEARFIRLTDADSQSGPAGSAEGFDLDAVVVLNGRATDPPTSDRDGDRLSDRAEEVLYGTDPDQADSDGDGTGDGVEVAHCRDPNTFAEQPWLVREARLWLFAADCTEARWTFLGTGVTYDLIRGDLSALIETAVRVDLGDTTCLVDEAAGVRWSCDSEAPQPAGGFFFLVRASGVDHYGWSSRLNPRETATGCP